MKKCPFCAEEIQDAAILCRFCNRDLGAAQETAPPTEVPSVSGGGMGWGVLIIVCVGLGVGGWIVASGLPTLSRTTSPVTVPPTTAIATATSTRTVYGPELALIASRGYASDGGYRIVEGQVQNIASIPLKNVTVVATWYTKDGQFITSDQALIDFNPLLPGQTSPFKTITTGNPAMDRYSVDFKELLGGAISVRDDRQKVDPPRRSPTGGGERRPPPREQEESNPAWLPAHLELRIERSTNQWRITNEQEYRWSDCTASVGLSEASLGTLEQNNTVLVFDSDFKPRLPESRSSIAVTCRVGRDRSFTTTRPWNTEQ